jgi:hypothetical protein
VKKLWNEKERKKGWGKALARQIRMSLQTWWRSSQGSVDSQSRSTFFKKFLGGMWRREVEKCLQREAGFLLLLQETGICLNQEGMAH